MWGQITNDDWFALFVKTNNEQSIVEHLEKAFGDKYKFYAPKRVMRERHSKKWVMILRPLFSGYILFQGKFEKTDYYQMKNIPGVYYLIKNEKGPIPMLKDEIELINHLLRFSNDDAIGSSDIYMEGQAIFVVNGPLEAMEGIIVSVNKRKGRAKVRLSVGGEEKLVELAVNMLNKKP